MPSFLTTPSIQWTKEQLQVRLNTNFQYEAIMLTIMLKGQRHCFQGAKNSKFIREKNHLEGMDSHWWH